MVLGVVPREEDVAVGAGVLVMGLPGAPISRVLGGRVCSVFLPQRSAWHPGNRYLGGGPGGWQLSPPARRHASYSSFFMFQNIWALRRASS